MENGSDPRRSRAAGRVPYVGVPSQPPEPSEPPSLDDALVDDAVLNVYRQMFASLAKDGGAVIADPAMVDVADSLFSAFARAGEEGLTHEDMRHACRQFPAEVFENRLGVLRGLGAIRETFPKPHQRRYRASFTSVVGLMFVRRMMADGGQSEMHRLLALEQLSVADPNFSADDARTSAESLIRAFRLWTVELASLASGKIEDLREQAPKLWGSAAVRERAEELHAAILDRWPELEHTCTELRAAIYAYGDVSLRAAGRLRDSAGTTRNLSLLPAETWRTFAQTASAGELAAVLDTFVFDAPAAWHSPGDVVDAVEDGPRTTPPRPAPPRSAVPDADLPVAAERPDATLVERLRSIAEQTLDGADAVEVQSVLAAAGDWASARRLLADLASLDLRPELPYRLRWTDGLTITPDAAPTWLSTGVFERVEVT